MTSSDLFSHPNQPEQTHHDKHTEPVSNPVFSDLQRPDSSATR